MAKVRAAYEPKHLSQVDDGKTASLEADIEETTNVITPVVTIAGVTNSEVTGSTSSQVTETGRMTLASDDLFKKIYKELKIMNLLLSGGLGLRADLYQLRLDMDEE